MLFFRKLRNVLLICNLGLLCMSCATSRQSDYSAPEDPVLATFHHSPEHLGMAYLTGQGVPENHRQAAYWLEKAAEEGSASAADTLGYLYASGNGVAQNYSLALQWYQQAADAGVASAQYNLGLMYAHGLGTPVDQAKANDYFNQAAARGFTPARQKSTL